MVRPYQSDDIDWDSGRESYEHSRTRQIPSKKAQTGPKRSGLLSIRGEERLGSLIAAAGTIWGVYVATHDYDSLWRMQIMSPGPMEVCALGVLAWLHAKWRRSTKVD